MVVKVWGVLVVKFQKSQRRKGWGERPPPTNQQAKCWHQQNILVSRNRFAHALWLVYPLSPLACHLSSPLWWFLKVCRLLNCSRAPEAASANIPNWAQGLADWKINIESLSELLREDLRPVLNALEDLLVGPRWILTNLRLVSERSVPLN
jgi:hypothetical protein